MLNLCSFVDTLKKCISTFHRQPFSRLKKRNDKHELFSFVSEFPRERINQPTLVDLVCSSWPSTKLSEELTATVLEGFLIKI